MFSYFNHVPFQRLLNFLCFFAYYWTLWTIGLWHPRKLKSISRNKQVKKSPYLCLWHFQVLSSSFEGLQMVQGFKKKNEIHWLKVWPLHNHKMPDSLSFTDPCSFMPFTHFCNGKQAASPIATVCQCAPVWHGLAGFHFKGKLKCFHMGKKWFGLLEQSSETVDKCVQPTDFPYVKTIQLCGSHSLKSKITKSRVIKMTVIKKKVKLILRCVCVRERASYLLWTSRWTGFVYAMFTVFAENFHWANYNKPIKGSWLRLIW